MEPSSKRNIIECHVFVVGMVKTAMTLVESCQKSFYESKVSVGEFYKKYGNVPVVFCMKEDLNNRGSSGGGGGGGGGGDSRMVVKNFDLNGYHYATDQTPIDVWQLFEEGEMPGGGDVGDYSSSDGSPAAEIMTAPKPTTRRVQAKTTTSGNGDDPAAATTPGFMAMPELSLPANKSSQVVNPYEKTNNLIEVEKKIDPITGQNIFVRYLNPDKSKSNNNPLVIKGLTINKTFPHSLFSTHFNCFLIVEYERCNNERSV